MYGQYELKFLVDQRHERALREAQTRRLAKQVRANRAPRSGSASATLLWGSATSLLRAMGPS